MDNPSQHVTRLINQACTQYPGGLRAVFCAIQEMEGKKKSESTFYADFNPNESSNGKLKVCDLLNAMQVTGNYEALRYMAALFGFSLVSVNAVEPDAPTLEEEMLQDIHSVVEFQKGCASFEKGEIGEIELDVLKDAAITEIRQTYVMATKRQK